MSKLLEIFGKGITINTAEVIWHWLGQSVLKEEPSDRTDLLLKIVDHLANREILQAEKSIRGYLSDFPDCTLGRMAAASACLFQNKIEETIQQVQSVYWRQPSNTMALYVMGYCYERLGRIEQAVEFYQDCVKFKNYLQLPRQRMAAIYLKEGRIDRAIREYEILTTEHPDEISAIILLGYLYLASNSVPQALDTFNLGILAHPDNFMSSQRDEQIQSLLDCELYEQALETIKTLIEQIGPSLELLVQMGDVYGQWGKEAEAIACYEHAIWIQPNSLEATIKLGTHYLRNQRFSLAAEQFNKASEINDEILDAYMGLALAQKLTGNTNEALQTLSLASSIEKNSVLLFSEAATLQFQFVLDDNLNETEMSDKEVVTIDHVIKAYQKQIRGSKKHSDIHYKYGILMLGENKLPEAISSFQNAFALNPENYRIKNKMIISIYDNDQPDKALNMLSNEESCGASIFEKYYQITMLYADKKAFAKAMSKLNTKKSSQSYENKQMRSSLENMLETLGIIDRSYTSWEQINETSECLSGVI